jgi:hypothetical protein
VEIYRSARKHGVSDDDILRAIEHAVIAAEQDDGKGLYLGADACEDGTDVLIHAMAVRRIYEPLLREMGGTDD